MVCEALVDVQVGEVSFSVLTSRGSVKENDPHHARYHRPDLSQSISDYRKRQRWPLQCTQKKDPGYSDFSLPDQILA